MIVIVFGVELSKVERLICGTCHLTRLVVACILLIELIDRQGLSRGDILPLAVFPFLLNFYNDNGRYKLDNCG